MPNEPVQIRVSEIGEFIRFQSCERRFKLGLDNRRLARAVPFPSASSTRSIRFYRRSGEMRRIAGKRRYKTEALATSRAYAIVTLTADPPHGQNFARPWRRSPLRQPLTGARSRLRDNSEAFRSTGGWTSCSPFGIAGHRDCVSSRQRQTARIAPISVFNLGSMC
jgi:hypothetical protein